MAKNLRNSLLGIAIEYRNNMRAYSPEFSGDLKSSLQFTHDDTSLEITGATYFKYMDRGVNGVGFTGKTMSEIDSKFASRKKNVVVSSIYNYVNKKPPISALREWSNAKGLNPYAVQNSIYTYGLEPRNILEKTFKNTKRVEERIVEGYIKDIRDMLVKKGKG